jgi:glycosyltransferase involved in cell wall biosynthesis
MRIAIDTRDLQVARTGARTYLEELCRVFPQAFPHHEFVFLAPKTAVPKRKTAVQKIHGHLSFYWWKEVQLPWLVRQHQCDILFCSDYVVPLWSPCPAVPTLFDASFWRTPEHYNKLWRFLLNRLGLPAVRNAPVIITISQTAKNELVKHAGLPAEKIVPVYLAPKTAVQTPLSDETATHILSRYGLLPQTPFILHVGVFEKRKNLPRLLAAFAQALPQIGDDWRLVLVGQPDPKKNSNATTDIVTAMQQLGLQNHVILTGYVPDEHLPAFYRCAVFYVLPSLHEGFGLPALEAFANHLPLAASNSTAVAEVTGSAALLFDPHSTAEIEQAIIQLAMDEALRCRLVAAGQKQLQQFSWEKTAAHILQLFEQIHQARRE